MIRKSLLICAIICAIIGVVIEDEPDVLCRIGAIIGICIGICIAIDFVKTRRKEAAVSKYIWWAGVHYRVLGSTPDGRYNIDIYGHSTSGVNNDPDVKLDRGEMETDGDYCLVKSRTPDDKPLLCLVRRPRDGEPYVVSGVHISITCDIEENCNWHNKRAALAAMAGGCVQGFHSCRGLWGDKVEVIWLDATVERIGDTPSLECLLSKSDEIVYYRDQEMGKRHKRSM